jgi:NifB/MoaA-like Fe-S oxidoreductase
MMRSERAGECLPVLRRLAGAGVELHLQIVLCPGYNDGPELTRTLGDIAALGPSVLSTAIVPVGLTAHRRGLTPLRPVSPSGAREAIAAAGQFERVWCADELYLLAGEDIPPAEHYGGFPQIQNGVGLTALFLKEWRQAAAPVSPARQTLFTGQAAAPLLRGLLAGSAVNVRPIRCDYFGGGVNAAGLVTGGDIAAQAAGEELGERALIPSVMLRAEGDMFLDDMTPQQLQEKLRCPVVPVEASGAALARALSCP